MGEVAADADAKATPAEDNKPKVILAEVEPLCVFKFWMSDKDADEVTALVDEVVRSSQTVQLGSFGGARDDKNKIKKQRDADACGDGDACDGGYARGSSSLFDCAARMRRGRVRTNPQAATLRGGQRSPPV